MDVNVILFGDCLKLMKDIDDKSIDMILCDLPYGATSRNKWDVIIPPDQLWTEYNRIIKDKGIIALTATQPFASQLISTNPKMFRYDLIWVKNKKTGFLNAKKMPMRCHESVLIFYKSLPTYNPQMTTGHKPMNAYTQHTDCGTNYGTTKPGCTGGGRTDRYPTSILHFPVVNNDSKERIHPTQKPVALFEYLIKTYTNENMLVLDNCIGSGTTAIAAINTNRNFIGMEGDIKFYELAKERIETAMKNKSPETNLNQ